MSVTLFHRNFEKKKKKIKIRICYILIIKSSVLPQFCIYVTSVLYVFNISKMVEKKNKIKQIWN